MEMEITFPGGARVDAHFFGFTVKTDQTPRGGGEGSAPEPFALFLVSIATCAGIYVLNFLRQRDLPTENVRILQRSHRNRDTRMIDKIEIQIEVPADIPPKYHEALIRSALLCPVKKHLEQPPEFEVGIGVTEPTSEV